MSKKRDRLITELGGKCATCGGSRELQFDHIDPRQKLADINHLIHCDPMRMLEEELRKCQLLCKSCHKAKTKIDRGLYEKRPLFHPTCIGANKSERFREDESPPKPLEYVGLDFLERLRLAHKEMAGPKFVKGESVPSIEDLWKADGRGMSFQEWFASRHSILDYP